MFGTFTILSVQYLIAKRIKKQVNLMNIDYIAILIQAVAAIIIFMNIGKINSFLATVSLSLSLVLFQITFNILFNYYRKKRTPKYPYLYASYNIFTFFLYCVIITMLKI